MHRRTAHMQRDAFTIIEILVVIAIISILIGIAITVGTKVTSGSKARQTSDTIRVLDTMFNEYQAAQGSTPGPTVNHPNAKGSTQVIVIADCVPFTASTTDKPLDTMAWLLMQMQESASAAGLVKSIPTKALQPSFVDTTTRKPQSYIDAIPDTVQFNTVLDAWGRPIRYVHPATDGLYENRAVYNSAQPLSGLLDRGPLKNRNYAPADGTLLNRTKLNSDGGTCPTNTPYFYSCGPDGDPSTVDDNVYTIVPTFPT